MMSIHTQRFRKGAHSSTVVGKVVEICSIDIYLIVGICGTCARYTQNPVCCFSRVWRQGLPSRVCIFIYVFAKRRSRTTLENNARSFQEMLATQL